jgi:hypothetical protein
MKMLRVISIALLAMGALSSRSASAAIQGEAIYSEKLPVPAFVKDVRTLIVNAARERGWKLIDERPGELMLELQHVKSHMTVVVRVPYSKSEFSFHKISANTFQCPPDVPCAVDPAIVQRWLISLRREAGVALLRLAIQDAGGTLPVRAPVAEAE